ncbi:MAG: GGDEF domain-containing protein [Planctomycetes bacterium]|nr:GGDEF domain-containing protein [Planctomycetota bacterium]
MARKTEDWRLTYFLGVALLLPIGTIVLTAYYFFRMGPLAREAVPFDAWAFSIIAISGGLSGIMAALLALFSHATWRARLRFENECRNLQRYLNEDVARERYRMQRNLDVFAAAQQISMALKQEVDFERILGLVLEQIEYFARAEQASVFVAGKGGLEPRALRRHGVTHFPPELASLEVEDSLVAQAIEHGQSRREFDEATGAYVFAASFSTPDGLRGVVRISRNIADDADFREEMPAFEQSVAHLARMLGLGLKQSTMWDRAIKDEKTGLYNANHYADQIKRMAATARRSGIALSLIMLDIDKFKHVNDTYGHLAGDLVLAQVAEILRREARESDTPFRYGGEELCIICQGCTSDDAALAAERLRSVIAHTEFHDDKGRLLPVSASFGVAEYNVAAMPSEKELKEACDKALYYAKAHGRNCVAVSEGEAQFYAIERSGDVESEVKRRLGLAGDNSPLNPAADSALQTPVANNEAATVRIQLGESIDALANGLAQVVGSDADRAKIVDSVVREAAAFLTQNLSARLTPQGAPCEADLPPKPKRKPRKTKIVTPAQAVTPPAAPAAEPAGEPVKQKRKRRTKAEIEAARRAKDEAAKKAESDRLDYLTDDEAAQLTEGKAPSKRLRDAAQSGRFA